MGIFGLNTNREDSKLIIINAPWDVTTSYGGGASKGPEAVLKASPQIDLYDLEFKEAYKLGFHLEKADPFFGQNDSLRKIAKKAIDEWDELGSLSNASKEIIDSINDTTADMVARVKQQALDIIKENKIPALLGGDHSTPQGVIEALTEKHNGDFGILHIDAHADLRVAYQGFTHSHASIMHNVMSLPTAPQSLVQVGIRDFCKEEFDSIESNDSIHTFFDRHLKAEQFDYTDKDSTSDLTNFKPSSEKSWTRQCMEILAKLPQKVYVSFDIDGLSPEFCPHTGTPVPGGLSYDQAVHLITVLGKSGKQIIGFDLNEVAPGADTEWDGNVGCRLLYQLCGWTVTTNA